MKDPHTGGVTMYDMLVTFLSAGLYPKWKTSMLGIASDSAHNIMTGWAAVVVTRLKNFMHNSCTLLRKWRGIHQVNLVME